MRNLLAISLLNALFIGASYAQGDCPKLSQSLNIPNFDQATKDTPVCLWINETDDNQKTVLKIRYRDKDNKNIEGESVGEKQLGTIIENDGMFSTFLPDFTMLDKSGNKLLTSNRDWTLLGDLSAEISNCNDEKIRKFSHDEFALRLPGSRMFKIDETKLKMHEFVPPHLPLTDGQIVVDLNDDKNLMAQATLEKGNPDPKKAKTPDEWKLCMYSNSEENLSTMLMMLMHKTDERNEEQVNRDREIKRQAKQKAKREKQNAEAAKAKAKEKKEKIANAKKAEEKAREEKAANVKD